MNDMKILMVCLGNICRSPLAEGILVKKLQGLNKQFFVDSAGTGSWHAGEPPDARSIAVARKFGIDLTTQRARKIIKEDLDEFDLIFTMDGQVHEEVISLAENDDQRKKIFLFLEYAGKASDTAVPDPYWGGQAEFEAIYQLLDESCDLVVMKLSQ